MKEPKEESEMRKRIKGIFHRIFETTILIRLIDGVFDLIAGGVLYFTSTARISDVAGALFRQELLEDPTDRLAHYLMQIADSLSVDTKIFAATYFLAHGTIKVFLSTALLKEKKWAFPVSGALMALFLIYQIKRFTKTHSIMLLSFIIIDIIILSLLRLEYRNYAKR